MAELLQLVSDWIVAFLMQVGLLGVFLALALESACIPITSEVFLLFAGFLVAQGRFGLFETALVGSLGFVTGSLFPYYVGRRHGKAILGRGGKFLLAGEEELERVEAWFERHGARAILFGRSIPVVRDFISLPAGHAQVPLPTFIAFTALGSFPWILGVTYVGRIMESKWRTILDLIQSGNLILLGVLLAGATFLVVRHLRHRKASQRS